MRLFFCIRSDWLRFFILILYFQTTNGTPEEEHFLCDQPLRSPSHQFPPKSRANKVSATLRYGNKPYWPMQWYMSEEVFSVADQVYSPSLKIAEYHNLNWKGENVGVVIIGNSPVNCAHNEISERCFPNSPSYSYHVKKTILSFCSKPGICLSESLATAVAGIIGMSDTSQSCGVGIAPKCKIGNIVIEPSTRGGSPESGAAKILSSASDPRIYVFVHAWSLSSHDYRIRILHGLDDINMLNFKSKRQMSPHVMGSGDLGQYASSCQCNEYASADSMFVFGSVAYDGFLTSYSDTCASVIGVTYSTSNGNEFYNNIITITQSTNDSPTYAPKRTTAVSAAMGGGIIALINEIFFQTFARSPSISDIAFLLAFSCTSESLKDKNIMWFTNGVGKEYSPQAGFGLPSMDKVLALLKNWIPLDSPTIYEFSRFNGHVAFKCRKDTRTRSLTYVFNQVCFFEIANSQAHRYIQLITVELSAKLMKRGALSVYLISPAGTVSCILEGRPYDILKKNYKNLLLRTNHFIGETLEGQWSIRFYVYKEDSKPSYDKLPKYSFPTQLQSTTAPPKSQFHYAGRHQPIIASGTSNTGPQSINANPASQASSSPQFVGQLVTGGDSSPRTTYPVFPNPTGATSNPVSQIPNENWPTNNFGIDPKPNHQSIPQTGVGHANEKPPGQGGSTHPQYFVNFQVPPVPAVQPSASHPQVKSSSGISFTTTNSPSRSYMNPNDADSNIIDQVNFRFLLIENLPSALKLQQTDKNVKQTKLDFELIKAWVDFRHFLLVQTDPKNFGTSTVGLWEVYDITNSFIKKLLLIQKKLKFNSEVSPLERWQKMFGSDLFAT